MKTSRFAAGCTILLDLALVARQAYAVCQDTPAATSATDLLMTPYNPCGSASLNYQVGTIFGDYDMVSDDWGNRGAATCNPSFGPQGMSTEVAKFFNAAELMVNGVTFLRNAPFARPFHGSSLNDSPQGDYGVLTVHGGNDFHDWDRYQVVDVLSASGGTTFAQYEWRSGIGIPNLIQGSCAIYDNPFEFGGPNRLASSDPAFRAADMVHESWHAWEHKFGQDINTSCGHTYCPGDHEPNPPPGSNLQNVSSVSCNPNSECDIWHPHPIGVCGFTAIASSGCTAGNDEGFMWTLFHRPYQAATEFACDVANNPQGWVPLIARELLASNADYYETNDSVNGTDPTMGATQPACYAMDFGVQYATCSTGANQCDEASPCASGLFCNPQSGCCQSAPLQCTTAGERTCDGTCDCISVTNCCSPAIN